MATSGLGKRFRVSENLRGATLLLQREANLRAIPTLLRELIYASRKLTGRNPVSGLSSVEQRKWSNRSNHGRLTTKLVDELVSLPRSPGLSSTRAEQTRMEVRWRAPWIPYRVVQPSPEGIRPLDHATSHEVAASISEAIWRAWWIRHVAISEERLRSNRLMLGWLRNTHSMGVPRQFNYSTDTFRFRKFSMWLMIVSKRIFIYFFFCFVFLYPYLFLFLISFVVLFIFDRYSAR